MGNCLTCIRSLLSWARSDSQSALVADDVGTDSSSPPAVPKSDNLTQQLLYEPIPTPATESVEPKQSHAPDEPGSVITQVDGMPFNFSKLGAMDQPTVVAAKPTGSALKGSAFAIEDCTNAILLLLDWSSQITVDVCKSCLIFIGPCDGSVFIRDCSDCTIFVIGRQVRFRDCSNCRVYLHCATAPALETSRGMTFHGFQGWYEQLQEHFTSANLEVYNNQWARVHDFSPPPDPDSPPNFVLQPSESWAAAQVHCPSSISTNLVANLAAVPILSGLNLSALSVPLTRPAQKQTVGNNLIVAVVRAGEAHRFAHLTKAGIIDCRALKEAIAIKAFGSEKVGPGVKLVAFLCSQEPPESAQDVVWQKVGLPGRDPAATTLGNVFST